MAHRNNYTNIPIRSDQHRPGETHIARPSNPHVLHPPQRGSSAEYSTAKFPHPTAVSDKHIGARGVSPMGSRNHSPVNRPSVQPVRPVQPAQQVQPGFSSPKYASNEHVHNHSLVEGHLPNCPAVHPAIQQIESHTQLPTERLVYTDAHLGTRHAHGVEGPHLYPPPIHQTTEIPRPPEAWRKTEYIPYEDRYIDYEEKIFKCPFERYEVDYYQVEHIVDYVPQEKEEIVVDMVPEERTYMRLHYVPVETYALPFFEKKSKK